MSITIIPEVNKMINGALPYILVSMFGFMAIMFYRISTRLSKMEGQIELLLKGRRLKMSDDK